MEISALGAVTGLLIAIVLIVYRVVPAYSLIAGAFLGGLIGGADPQTTIKMMIGGVQGIIPATMRIVTAGVLVGILIESGATSKIAETIIHWFGSRYALFSLAIATMLLTMVGVFIDIAVLTVAPIALAVAKEAGYSRFAVLFAMIGGGKSGNVISPNPNTIAAAENFHLELPTLMAANIIPAIAGLLATFLIANLIHRFTRKPINDPPWEKNPEKLTTSESGTDLPSFGAAILGPVIAILLLALRPISALFHVSLFQFDPMIALPIGGVVGCLAMGKARFLGSYMTSGLNKMSGVALLLLGTGTIAGIIGSSTLTHVFQDFLASTGLPGFMLAPVSGILMSAATASTTAGTAVASSAFHDTLLEIGITPLAAAAMIHAGATVLDHLPHGSFFHVTGGSVGMAFYERIRMIPFETTIGLVLVTISTLVHAPESIRMILMMFVYICHCVFW